MKQKTTNSYLYILVVVGIISAFGPFVTDFYLPALPALSLYFGTSRSLVQMSLTVSMIGLAVGQLFIGPFSDRLGRKRPLVASMVLFLAATAACLFSANIGQFLVFRFVQGIAGAGGVVISKSIATDLYRGRELTRFFSVLSSVQGLAPICAPVLGGLLLMVTDWRGIFWALLGVGAVLLAALGRFRESMLTENRSSGGATAIVKSYLPVIGNCRFMAYVLTQSFAMGVMFTYMAASPFLFQVRYGVSPLAFSLYFGLNALGIMAGSLLVLRFRSPERALRTATAAFLALSIVVAFVLVAGWPIVYVEASLFVLLLFLGMILPSSTTLALDLQRENSGNASAVLGFLTFLFGGICSPLAGLGNLICPTSVLIVVCSTGAWICQRWAIRK